MNNSNTQRNLFSTACNDYASVISVIRNSDPSGLETGQSNPNNLLQASFPDLETRRRWPPGPGMRSLLVSVPPPSQSQSIHAEGLLQQYPLYNNCSLLPNHAAFGHPSQPFLQPVLVDPSQNVLSTTIHEHPPQLPLPSVPVPGQAVPFSLPHYGVPSGVTVLKQHVPRRANCLPWALAPLQNISTPSDPQVHMTPQQHTESTQTIPSCLLQSDAFCSFPVQTIHNSTYSSLPVQSVHQSTDYNLPVESTNNGINSNLPLDFTGISRYSNLPADLTQNSRHFDLSLHPTYNSSHNLPVHPTPNGSFSSSQLRNTHNGRHSPYCLDRRPMNESKFCAVPALGFSVGRTPRSFHTTKQVTSFHTTKPVTSSNRRHTWYTSKKQQQTEMVPTSEKLSGGKTPSHALTLDKLPDVVLIHVLSYLSIPDRVLRARQTCKRLYGLSHEPTLWKTVKVNNFGGLDPNRFLTALLEQKCFVSGRVPLQLADTIIPDLSHVLEGTDQVELTGFNHENSKLTNTARIYEIDDDTATHRNHRNDMDDPNAINQNQHSDGAVAMNSIDCHQETTMGIMGPGNSNQIIANDADLAILNSKAEWEEEGGVLRGKKRKQRENETDQKETGMMRKAMCPDHNTPNELEGSCTNYEFPEQLNSTEKEKTVNITKMNDIETSRTTVNRIRELKLKELDPNKSGDKKAGAIGKNNTGDKYEHIVIEEDKRVKDHIRELVINNLSQFMPFCFTNNSAFKRTLTVITTKKLKAPSEKLLCRSLERLALIHTELDPTFLTMIDNHPWLTHLSVTMLDNSPYVRIQDDDLALAYDSFRKLKNLRNFKFVFATSRRLTNSLLGNVLFFNTAIVHTAMRKFFEKATILEEVMVSGVNDVVLQVILTKCTNLKTLAFTTFSLAQSTFDRCVGFYQHTALQSLTINCCLNKLNFAIMEKIAAALPNLKAVNLTGSHVTQRGLAAVLSRCKKLEAVHLHKTCKEFPRGNSKTVYSVSTLLSLCLPNRTPLRELSIPADLDDRFIERFCACNATLQSLTLIKCPNLTDASLVTLSEQCPSLSCITFDQDKSNISASAILTFVRKNSTLASINMSSVTNKGRMVPFHQRQSVVRLIGPGKRKLSLGHIYKSDSINPARTNAYPRHSNTQNKNISLRRKSDEGLVNDYGSYSSLIPTVESNHSQYYRMTDDHTQCEVKGISLGKVPQLNWEDVLVIVRTCPHLVELELHGCLLLCDKSVRIILSHCPQLRVLTVDRYSRGVRNRRCFLTDVTLNLVVQLGQRLQQLTVKHAYRFTAKTVARTLLDARDLRNLFMTFGRRHYISALMDIVHELWCLSDARSAMGYSSDMKLGFSIQEEDDRYTKLLHVKRLLNYQD